MLKELLLSQLDALLERHGQVRVLRSDPTALRGLISMFHPQDVGIGLIRLGGEGDGGYLVPDDLDGIAACFSPGVSDVADFETSLIRDYGIPCYLADASVDGPPPGTPGLDFEKKFLGDRADATTRRRCA